MSKRLFDIMSENLAEFLHKTPVDLLSVEQGVKKNENGSQEPFTRVEVEIPKGNGAFSRCRFSCKLPPTQFNVSEDEIESGVSVLLTGIKITYVSAQKEVYTKADDAQIV